jgi:hypothetical protein
MRQKDIAHSICLPKVILIMICEYDNDAWDMLQKVCKDIQILIQIPRFINIYNMPSVKLRVDYINRVPSRTCLYCKLFPNFIIFIRNHKIGLRWPVHGCYLCYNNISGILKDV